MQIDISGLNWVAILVSVIIGQVFLTVWFAVIFADSWAKAYGDADKAQHTREIPGYTYAVGLACMILLTIGLALLQQGLGVTTLGAGLGSGFMVALCFCTATALPGYAFLRKWNAAMLAIGSQVVLILILSTILAVWQ